MIQWQMVLLILMSVISDFISDIKNVFSMNRVLGIDIGTVSMRLVQVSRKGGMLFLDTYGTLETKDYLRRANAALQTSSLKISENDIIPLLKTLLRETGAKADRVVASIPIFSAFFTSLDMPMMSGEETAKSISFQARQYIPLKPDEVTIDWVKTGEFETEKGDKIQRVMITGIPNILIAKYRAIFKAAGLNLVALELETNALARVFSGDSHGGPKLVLDIGGEASSIAVIYKGISHELGTTDYGGLTLTQAISRSLGISAIRAEELKRKKGLSKSENEYELSTSLYPFIDVILQEARRVRDVFERRSKMSVQGIMIVGGGANLVGIEGYIKERLGLPVLVADTLDRFRFPTQIEPMFKSLNKEFAVASGLALRFYV